LNRYTFKKNDKKNYKKMTECKEKCLMQKMFSRVFYRKKNPVVAYINLNGVIGQGNRVNAGINIDNVFPLLEKAFSTKKVSAVAINVNSPGGSPVQSELIYKAIRELSSAKKIPVFSFARDVAASGGYWLLLSGDEIYASNASIIGSIGVISSGFGFVDIINKIGVERRVYAEGKNKAILDPFLPEDSENTEILKSAQSDIFEDFKGIVKSRRGSKLTEEEKIFTGAFWSGKTSAKLGLVDGISDMRSKMQEKFGEKVEFINVVIKKGFIKSFLSENSEKLDFASSAIQKIEEKMSFQRFGL
jgi:signal peptide peptidase SppA